MPNTKPHPVPDSLIEALEAVLAHWWSDERRDYEEWHSEDTPRRPPHIFTALEVIRRWLDYLEEESGRG